MQPRRFSVNKENLPAVKENRVILVIEGDDAVYSVIRSSLLAGEEGYSVVRMSSQELAGMLAADAPGRKPGVGEAHALLLDDGWLGGRSTQILSQLRTHELLARVPVVMLVGSQDERRISEYQTLGASICILRGGSEEILRDTIARLGAFLSVVQVPQR
jgi:DNA-binding NarL/FixJ family response regulator